MVSLAFRRVPPARGTRPSARIRLDEPPLKQRSALRAQGVALDGDDGVPAVVVGDVGDDELVAGRDVAQEGDPDRARSLTYARVLHLGADDLAGRSWECFGEYSDLWERTGEGWRITSRRFDVRFDLGDPSVLRRG